MNVRTETGVPTDVEATTEMGLGPLTACLCHLLGFEQRGRQFLKSEHPQTTPSHRWGN